METPMDHNVSGLLGEVRGPVVYWTLNRPEKRNALSRSLLCEMEEAQKRVAADAAVRIVVVAGAGSAFCAGHDLSEMTGRTEEDYRDLFALCARVMLGFRRLPQPVLARVHGTATAAGCQLVAACDLAIAAEEATFATPGVHIGLVCATPLVPLMRAVSPKVALEMVLTGQPITAQRALAAGLVNRVVSSAELDAVVQQYVAALLAAAPLSLRLGKRAFYDQRTLDEATAYERAVEVFTQNALSRDAQEGIAAFLHKRPPVWRDE